MITLWVPKRREVPTMGHSTQSPTHTHTIENLENLNTDTGWTSWQVINHFPSNYSPLFHTGKGECAKKKFDVNTGNETLCNSNIETSLRYLWRYKARRQTHSIETWHLHPISIISKPHLSHHIPGKICSHMNQAFNRESWIKGPLSSQETFVLSDRFQRDFMVTSNLAWKREFIKWIDLKQKRSVGIITLSQTKLLFGNLPRTSF